MPVSANATDIYEGSDKYLKAVDFKAGERTLTITDANETTFKNGDKQIALSFQGETKTLGLNKTNYGAISFAYGKDPNGWNGRQIVAFATTTANQSGQIVPCVRVRIPSGTAQPAPSTTYAVFVPVKIEKLAWTDPKGQGRSAYAIDSKDGIRYGMIVPDGPDGAGTIADLNAAVKLAGVVRAEVQYDRGGKPMIQRVLPPQTTSVEPDADYNDDMPNF